MNKQELLEIIKDKPYEKGIFVDTIKFNRNWLLRKIEKLDEPEMGHTDEAPRYVKNILARLRELPVHDREVWLKAIMSEFEQDFSHAKWREGYEQGKLEGMLNCEKVTVPQFVADWIEYCKFTHADLQSALVVGDVYFYNYANQKDFSKLKEFLETENNQETFARAWLDGYEVEKEKRYEVILCNGQSLKTVYRQGSDHLDFKMVYGDLESFTRKQLEEADFGWVFDCPGVEVEEVE